MNIIDVGAGFKKYPGAISIDANPRTRPEILHDLNSYPWPIESSTFDMIYSSHCLEHLQDPKKALEEMWRIAKPGARLLLKVPHFSSRVAWTDIEHTRAFGIHLLRRYTGLFQERSATDIAFSVNKIELHWHQEIDLEFMPPRLRPFLPLIHGVNAVISAAANFSIEACERLWCYYVGGMGEVLFDAQVIKAPDTAQGATDHGQKSRPPLL